MMQSIQLGCCLSLSSFVPQAGGMPQAASFQDTFPVLKEQLSILLENKFDFAELTVGTIANLTDEEFEEFARYLKNGSCIKVPVYNSFVPPDIKLTGPQADPNAIEAYVKKVTERVRKAGGKLIIFGSGAARSIPDGYSKEMADRQIDRFLKSCEKYAVINKLEIAVEPLNRQESNIINTVREAAELVRRLDYPHIKLLADSYHMDLEDEPYGVLKDTSGLLAHVHVAGKNRAFPDGSGGDHDLESLFSVLHGMDYPGMISLECKYNNLRQESAKALAYLQSLRG